VSPAARPAARAWPDLDPLRRSLFADDARGVAAPAWLSDGAADPDGFWRALAPALMAAPAGSSRSTAFERYQLAHEMGARHAGGRSAGFVTYDDASGFRASSYARLVETARALAGAWRMRGLEAGMCVALVAPVSPELVVGLLAAWHLGAVPAPIPVWGRTYLADRLAALAPDFVATTKGRALWLEIPPEQRLSALATGAEPDPGLAHWYAASEPALRVFSPLGDAPLCPFDVPAERLYLARSATAHSSSASAPSWARPRPASARRRSSPRCSWPAWPPARTSSGSASTTPAASRSASSTGASTSSASTRACATRSSPPIRAAAARPAGSGTQPPRTSRMCGGAWPRRGRSLARAAPATSRARSRGAR
jgi:hypothetical protein